MSSQYNTHDNMKSLIIIQHFDIQFKIQLKKQKSTKNYEYHINGSNLTR